MARRAEADLQHLPEFADGLTLTEAAARLTKRLDRHVEPKQVHYLVARRKVVKMGRKRIVPRPKPRTVEAISEQDLEALATAYERQYPRTGLTTSPPPG